MGKTEHILDKRALDVLNRTQEIGETVDYCSPDGDLTGQIH
jgi:hypothetical protein